MRAMKKIIALSAALFALVLVGTPQKAEAAPYGDAGCGLGSLLFGSQPGLVQVLAATTNGTLGSQTFGITTGTSNCGLSGGAMGARNFVETNRETFAKDAARGQGETIATLSGIAGCTDQQAVGQVLQSNFNQVFPSVHASDKQVSANVLTVLKSDPGLGCKKI
jgi:hypothetical protein